MKNCCVIGLGYIGLPTALLVAKSGFKVLGVDINPKIIELLNSGEIHIVEPGLEQLVKDSGFTIIDSGTACGPCFALSSMIKEFLKNYLPLGKYISFVWKLSFGLILSKFDFFIINKNDSHKLAFGVFCLAKK